ncbi:NnrU family protein [Prochlorococcus sp. AH-716-O10]|nr:NnrU family protein [Prochlorococcus sp. AH-716-O10]
METHKTSLLILVLILIFAVIHSGGAALRSRAEAVIGPRLWRLLFVSLSLPSAVILISYFLAHRYDGIRLWNLQGNNYVFLLVWILTAISFLFLYPATYNLLEIPSVLKPQVRIYGTGIMRITRHPQAFGQIIWCLAHTLWIGTSFTFITSLGLICHHLFAIWHGDKRLEIKFGEEFYKYKESTSVIPFVAIFDGRQQIKVKEFLKLSQLGILIAIAIIWWSHKYINIAVTTFNSSFMSKIFN